MRNLILILFSLFCVSASAELYTWKDSTGTHYSDSPPENLPGVRRLRDVQSGSRTEIPVDEGDTAKNAPAANNIDPKLQARKREKEMQEAAIKAREDQKQDAVRAENCARARGQLIAVESGNARFNINEKGERVALEGKALNDALAQTRQSVESWCTPLPPTPPAAPAAVPSATP